MPHVFADNTGEPEGEVYGSVSTRQGKSISNRVHSANDWRCPCSSLVRKAEADVTKTYEWRIDQLDRLTRMLKDNYERFADASRKDFKTELRGRQSKVPSLDDRDVPGLARYDATAELHGGASRHAGPRCVGFPDPVQRLPHHRAR